MKLSSDCCQTRRGRPLPAIALLAAIGLSGCAYSPGLQLFPGDAAPSASSKVTLLSLLNTPKAATSAATAPTARQDGADPAPAGALTPITADLIRQQKTARPGKIEDSVRHLFGTPQPYTIGPGDVLNIMVWDHPEISLPAAGGTTSTTDPTLTSPVGNGYNISPSGTIQYPYIGSIKLAGLTEDQARTKLTQQLAKYIKDPQITLRIQAYRSGRVYLDGDVRTPGLQSINDVPLNLSEALARAGGLLPTADRSSIHITRGGKTTTVNLSQLIAEGVNPNQILLAAGDLVRVASLDEAKVYVMGEVVQPSTLTLRHGKLNLNQALGESRGINPVSGDPKQVYVVRSDGGEKPQIFHLDASNAVAYALAEGFELRARDVVYVDPVPLVRWNRVISLLLPSAQAVNTTRTATGN